MSEELIKAELKSLGVVPPAAEKPELVAALLNARANSTPMFDTSQFGDKGTQWYAVVTTGVLVSQYTLRGRPFD